MDWTTIITAILAALIPTGGVVTLFTLREKKTDMFLDNAQKTINEWKDLVDSYKKDSESKDVTIERKEEMLTTQIKMNSTLRKKLDKVNTACAVAKMMRCDTLNCPSRVPPLGAGYDPADDEAMPE